MKRVLTVVVCSVVSMAHADGPKPTWPQYATNPFAIELDQDPPTNTGGGIAVGDVNGDGLLDYLVTTDRVIGVYDHNGRKLWVKKEKLRPGGSAETVGLPGHNHPRIEVHDIDGDGRAEALYLRKDGELVIVDARSGKERFTHRPVKPENAAGWEAFTVCNLRGRGDRDIILQATGVRGPESRRGAKRGLYVYAFPLERLDGPPLWKTHRFWGLAHGPLRVGDLDGDGRDEVAGVTVLDHDGSQLTTWKYTDRWNRKRHGSFHMDSVFLCDVRPDQPGIEIVLLEEGANAVSLVNMSEFLWRKDHKRQEPQNAAVGEFDPNRPGLEIWCRSRYNTHQKPWVMDATGKVVAAWEMSKVAPKGWTDAGVEVIWAIDWDGGPKQFACATERHTSGDVCIFDPMNGRFIKVFEEKADRLMVADVSGDWREEIMVVSGRVLHIYFNETPNPRPDRARLWEHKPYRRSKANYNYYSP